MCLAMPMRLVEFDELGTGVAELDGARHKVNLSLVDEPKVGEYLIVHAGFAIEKLDEQEAMTRLELFSEMAAGVAAEDAAAAAGEALERPAGADENS